jgi:hypothetical protein
VAFFAAGAFFVYRSFYGMRIKSGEAVESAPPPPSRREPETVGAV